MKWVNIPDEKRHPKDDRGWFRIDRYDPLYVPEPGQQAVKNPKVIFESADTERICPAKLDAAGMHALSQRFNVLFATTGLNASIQWRNIPNEDTNPRGDTVYYRLTRLKVEEAIPPKPVTYDKVSGWQEGVTPS